METYATIGLKSLPPDYTFKIKVQTLRYFIAIDNSVGYSKTLSEIQKD